MNDPGESARSMGLLTTALALADEQGDTLIAALLAECVDALEARHVSRPRPGRP